MIFICCVSLFPSIFSSLLSCAGLSTEIDCFDKVIAAEDKFIDRIRELRGLILEYSLIDNLEWLRIAGEPETKRLIRESDMLIRSIEQNLDHYMVNRLNRRTLNEYCFEDSLATSVDTKAIINELLKTLTAYDRVYRDIEEKIKEFKKQKFTKTKEAKNVHHQVKKIINYKLVENSKYIKLLNACFKEATFASDSSINDNSEACLLRETRI